MEFYIIVVFLIIAILYASVGFGGGSSYMAILALAGIPFLEMRSISLCCNIVVIAVNVYHHWKEKNIDWKNTFLICSISIPLAYGGSLIHFKEATFLKILGVSLIIASVMMGFNYFLNKNRKYTLPKSKTVAVVIGGGIGFLSGITGIGGGIFLSPVLYLMQFSIPKKIAALSSVFIAVNSISGITGLVYKNNFHFTPTIHIPLLLAVLLGGFLGNKLRFKYLSPFRLTLLTALLIFYVGLKLVMDNG